MYPALPGRRPTGREGAGLDEGARRRPGFRGGLPVLLADDRPWAIPGPRETSPDGVPDERTARLVRWVAEARSREGRLLGEMALAIHLLALNYDLGPGEYRRLLEVDRSDPRFGRMIDDFHAIYLRHAAALAPSPDARPRRARPLAYAVAAGKAG